MVDVTAEEPSTSEAPSSAGTTGTVGSDVRRTVSADDEVDGTSGDDEDDELCPSGMAFSELLVSLETDAVDDASPSDVVAASAFGGDSPVTVVEDEPELNVPTADVPVSSFFAWFFSFARRFWNQT